jgi:transcriptional regulator with XRE-family HTH domain
MGTPRTKSQKRRPRSRFEDEYGVLLQRLIEARKAAGVTQVEIARRLGKTQSHVSMCENREREISIIDLWKWCQALNIKLSTFTRDFEEELERFEQ